MFHKILQIALAFYYWNTGPGDQATCQHTCCKYFKDSGTSVLCCQDNCLSCSRNPQTCEQCKDGYWLDGRRSCRRCPDKCEKCTDATYCTKCKAGFYTVGTCASPCLLSCDTSGCESTGYCYGCPRGFYGPYCQYSCNLCRNGSCSLRQCTYGCIDGYTEENGQCVKCHINCKLCKHQGYCLECNKGFYRHPYVSGNGNNSFYCVSCISVCEECSSVTDCIKCKPGNYGKTCEFTCSESYCHMCNETEGGDKCTECIAGYRLNGTLCVPQNVCSQNCVNGCNKNRECTDGCKDEWTGKTCSDQCEARCQKCDQSDWMVCSLCKSDSYTTSCNVNCSSHCSRISGRQTCELNDGYCLNGCIDGYRGDNCNLTASSVITTTASVPYSGEPDERSKGPSGTAMFFLGMVTGVGICLVVAVGTGIVCFRKRKKRRQKKMTETKSISDGERRVYVNTAFGTCMEAEPSTSAVDKYEHRDNDQTQAPDSVYDRLEDRMLGEQTQYSELVRPTGRQGTHEGVS